MASSKELKALITLAGKVDPSLQSALLKAQKGTADTTMKLSKLEQVGVKALNATRKAAKATAVGLAALAVSGGAALWQLGKEGIETASNLAEVQNVVDVTFADSAKEIDAWSSNLLNSYGLAELAAKKYASTIGAMLKSSGVADDDMRVMSKDLTQLTADMASFYNLDSDEAFNKIRSGISGETEPLKQLGINMSVANMQAFALSKGITKSYSAMSQAEQMTLRYQYLMSVTADAQGDFARTSDSFANQQKLLKENMSQLADDYDRCSSRTGSRRKEPECNDSLCGHRNAGELCDAGCKPRSWSDADCDRSPTGDHQTAELNSPTGAGACKSGVAAFDQVPGFGGARDQ